MMCVLGGSRPASQNQQTAYVPWLSSHLSVINRSVLCDGGNGVFVCLFKVVIINTRSGSEARRLCIPRCVSLPYHMELEHDMKLSRISRPFQLFTKFTHTSVKTGNFYLPQIFFCLFVRSSPSPSSSHGSLCDSTSRGGSASYPSPLSPQQSSSHLIVCVFSPVGFCTSDGLHAKWLPSGRHQQRLYDSCGPLVVQSILGYQVRTPCIVSYSVRYTLYVCCAKVEII